ncbi:MAG: metallophosphoesterase [Bryobacteraceae bacterium]
MVARWAAAAFLVFAVECGAQEFYIYVGQLTSHSALLAWGRLGGLGNTIGRDSKSYGNAQITIGERKVQTDRNWAEVDGLRPDTKYEYHIDLHGKRIGDGNIRTYPERADKLTFFVIGDFGTGSSKQYRVAEAMSNEFRKRGASENPPRFVLTVGDNIYADVRIGNVILRSGDEDRHWESKFFRPYKEILRYIPFYPTLGNHDGNATENRGDLSVYLDNFFFPGNKPARWYEFSYGGLADFFALDSTGNTAEGPPNDIFVKGGEEMTWLGQALARSHAPWKIPYFHHAVYTAGPSHESGLQPLAGFIELFRNHGVRVVFTGHEHNFQYSQVSAATGGACYVVSGAGGALRPGNVERFMKRGHIEGWAPQRHFLVVEIQGNVLQFTPVSYEPVRILDKDGEPLPAPVTIRLQ